MQFSQKLISDILSASLAIIRPLLGPANCKFVPTCTPYAHEQLQTQSLPTALKNITLRVLSCNPFTK